MNTLVVGYDGTSGARAALREAVALAGDLGGGLHVVFAYERAWAGGELADQDAIIREHADSVLSEASEAAGHGTAEVTTQVVLASPAEALLTVADEQDARMIVVGSYGETPFKGALVGSTPHRLVHLSSRPVLVVRADI